jgi:nucleoside-diphosphate-sugar epimerase
MAFIHGFSHVSAYGRLRIFLGGSPAKIADRFMATMIGTDQRAIETMGGALANSASPFIITVGTLGLAPGHLATEADAADPDAAGAARSVPSEQAAKALASRGLRAMVMRLPPSVHGDGDTGFIPQLIATARKKRVSAMIGDGHNRWPAVHRLDVAQLYRLALEKGEVGATYHGVADEGVPTNEIAEVIGRRLSLCVVSKTAKQASRHFGWLGNFFGVDNPISSNLTRGRLGWYPKQPGLIDDIDRASYFKPRN